MELQFIKCSTALRWRHVVFSVKGYWEDCAIRSILVLVIIPETKCHRGHTCHSQLGHPCLQSGNNCSLPDIFITVFLLHHPWKEAVANNLCSAAFPARGTDLGQWGVFLGLAILPCLLFLEAGAGSLCAAAFVRGWACWCLGLIFPGNMSGLSSPFLCTTYRHLHFWFYKISSSSSSARFWTPSIYGDL